MMGRWLSLAAPLALAAALAGCASGGRAPALATAAAQAVAPVAAAPTVSALRFIGEQRIPHLAQFEGTTLGGFSGLDYDPARGAWVIESDDRCSRNPARYYDAALDIDSSALRAVRLQGVHYFLNADGQDFAASATGCDRLDVESIRIDPQDGSIWYSSEGDRRVGLSPFVRHASRDGSLLAELPLPDNFKAHRDEERGSRYNLAIEGFAFAPDGRSLWLSMEGPLYEDGPMASAEHGAVVRMTNIDRNGKLLRQFAYPVDAIPLPPAPGKEADIGVSEILGLAGGELLVLERAAVQNAGGMHQNFIRLYATDARAASDTRAIAGLAGAAFTPAKKRLVLNLNTLGLERLDNLEGMAWGPRLPNGNATLVLVSDDNFGKQQVTQFLLFEVIP